VEAARLFDQSGRPFEAPVWRWFEEAGPEELRLLRDVVGPVLDVGCGPGRHTLTLAGRGIITLGIDVCDLALAAARDRRAPVLRRSVFDRVPGASRWATALLLDGNLGLGGDPTALLTRLGAILSPCGRVLVEVEEHSVPPTPVRFESPHAVGPWFDLARVGRHELPTVAAAAGWHVASTRWEGARSFARLERAA
jgi:SAM-dependent methyltransferase